MDAAAPPKSSGKKKRGDSNTSSTAAAGSGADGSAAATTASAVTLFAVVANSLFLVALLQILYRMLIEAYTIRLYAIEEYGRVIHEFDPYFNYRATEYLWKHGWHNFSHWFDYKVWYPLGRPVGTTIYPGMQVTSCAIKQFLLPDWSINDICCFVPAWFGVLATISVAWLTFACVSGKRSDFRCLLEDVPLARQVHETLLVPLAEMLIRLLKQLTGSDWGLVPLDQGPGTPWTTAVACSVGAAALMAIVPAHLLRSVGGGYDNESIAMTAMVSTFAAWTTSLLNKDDPKLVWNAVWGVVTGVAYFNMVAAWGGYVFVLNLIAVHAGVLVLLGRYSRKLWLAYTCFYVVGTALAIRVPVVGWTPLKSLEQVGALVAFGGLQLLELSDYLIARKQRKRRGRPLTPLQKWKVRLTVFLVAGAAAGAVGAVLVSRGYFGPISSRVRGLFVKHTKTGNPLVDSVAEHQAASPQAYFQYLNNIVYLAPVGFAVTALFYVSDSSSFLLVYGLMAYFFSHRMVRLILLTAPIASCFGGIVLGRFAAWMFTGFAGAAPLDIGELLSSGGGGGGSSEPSSGGEQEGNKAKGRKNGRAKPAANAGSGSSSTGIKSSSQDPIVVRLIRVMVSVYAVYSFIPLARDFWEYSHQMAHHISHPSIIMKGTLQDGSEVTVDDYREAYVWLRKNTPEDARIMAWWDYGYQITGISERTTIADGNTWNHEHIAFLGRTLTSPEKEAHRIARHMADYVLVWAGGGGDDLAKSPHLRRIANSVFRGLCAEPTCRDFGFHPDRTPTEDLEESLLYKLVANQIKPEVTVDKNRFKEVYRTKFGKVRIYKIMSVSKESKEWVADPANRICDAPGSWVCRGQYPPALRKILAEKQDFKQLEDFNADKEDDSEYQREYMENLMKGPGHNPRGPSDAKSMKKRKKEEKIELKELTKEDIELINENWENNEATTLLWQLISQGQVDSLKSLFQQSTNPAHVRSEDGRGPMWWAHEYGQQEIVDLLKSVGVSDDRKDKEGVTPLDIAKTKTTS